MHLLMAARLSFSHCKFITSSVEDAVQVAQAACCQLYSLCSSRDEGSGGVSALQGASFRVAFIKVQRLLIKNSPRQTLPSSSVKIWTRQQRSLAVCHIVLASSGKWHAACSTVSSCQLEIAARSYLLAKLSQLQLQLHTEKSRCQFADFHFYLSVSSSLSHSLTYFLYLLPISLFLATICGQFALSVNSLGLLFLPFSRCPFHITFSRFCCLLSGERARLVLHSNCAYASHDNCISHSHFVVVLVVAPTKQSCDICAEKKKRIIKLARAAN